jgi:putative ABC transport system ATP-binding protein
VTSPAPILQARGLHFAWERDRVLSFPPLQLARGDSLFVHGASGSGKSTLLGLLAGVLAPLHGDLHIVGQDMIQMSQAARDRVRADHIGYIFQQFNLLPYLDVASNVRLSCQFSPLRQRVATRTAPLPAEIDRLLDALELDPRTIRNRPTASLSVGQQQRVAAARALIGGPALLIADEPTSALDTKSRSAFIELLLSECERHETALVFVSHDLALAAHFDRSVELFP